MTYNQVLKTGRPCKRSHSPTDLPQRKWRVRTASPTDPGYPLGGIPSGITTYTRDIRGLITGQNNSNGTNSAFYIDSCRRTTYINHIQGSTPVFWIGYAHDLAGNPLVKTTSGGTYTSVYDPINQLIYHQTPSETQSLTYDGAFRRIQQLDALGLTEFNYNAAGQLMTATGARPATCTYDDNGNTTTIETAAGLTSYAWDDLGRLSGATLPGGQVLTMTHRFDNLLTSKAGPYGIQTLLWDGQNVATGTGPASTATPAAASAVFVGTDTATQGNWKTVYGSDGYNIIQDAPASYPSYATVSETGTNNNTWTSSTTDVRALEQVVTGRIAACWYNNTTFTVNIDLTDGKPHQVAIYCLDWDEVGRTGTVSVLDANSGAVLNTQNLSSYQNGIYLIWTITGSVQLVFTNTEAHENAVVSGLFFDPPIAKCIFVGTDTATQGNWIDVYGSDGYNIIDKAVSYPSYATVSESGITTFPWDSSTTDVRALEYPPPGTSRIAACWYSDSNFTVDINFTDGNTHKLTAYFLDWDVAGRTETVAIKDFRTGDTLSTQSLSSFSNGIYLSWTITGNVKLVVTNTNDEENGVISGLFFDSFPTPPTGGYGMIAMGAGLTRSVGVDANGNPVVRQYHMDSLGSVVAITDGQGNLVTNYQIDAWGNVLSGGTPGNAFDYLGGLGYWSDPDLGLQYVRDRWLNPQFGSWMSVDPRLDEFAYQYANNMPTTATDPSGEDAELETALGIFEGKHPENLTPHQIRLILKDAVTTGLGKDRYLSLEGLAALEQLYFSEVMARTPTAAVPTPAAPSVDQGAAGTLALAKQRPPFTASPAGPSFVEPLTGGLNTGIGGLNARPSGGNGLTYGQTAYSDAVIFALQNSKSYRQQYYRGQIAGSLAEQFGPGATVDQMRQIGTTGLAARHEAQQKAARDAAAKDALKVFQTYGSLDVWPKDARARFDQDQGVVAQYNRAHGYGSGLITGMIPWFEDVAGDQTGVYGGLVNVAMGLVNNIPLILGTGALGEAAGVSKALAKVFQIYGGIGVASQIGDFDAWRADPAKHATKLVGNAMFSLSGPLTAEAINKAAYMAVPYATTRDYGIFWEGYPDARRIATDLSKGGFGTTIGRTAGGRVLDAANWIAQYTGRPDGLDPEVFIRASKVFARSVNPSRATVVLVQLEGAKLVTRIPGGRGTSVFSKHELPILNDRGVPEIGYYRFDRTTGENMFVPWRRGN